MKVVQLDQKSNDWLLWRQTGLGSSDAAAILGLSKWTTAEELWAQKVGQAENKRNNSAMQRGVRLEPKAREIYEKIMGWKVEPICCVHDQYGWLKASLDGWNSELRLVVEIKAPNKDDHREALNGKVPLHYQPQVDHLLLVSDGLQAHYVSYNPNFKDAEHLAIVPWLPKKDRLERLFRAESTFWDHVRTRTPLSSEAA